MTSDYVLMIVKVVLAMALVSTLGEGRLSSHKSFNRLTTDFGSNFAVT